jgi:hypothetical protein
LFDTPNLPTQSSNTRPPARAAASQIASALAGMSGDAIAGERVPTGKLDGGMAVS